MRNFIRLLLFLSFQPAISFAGSHTILLKSRTIQTVDNFSEWQDMKVGPEDVFNGRYYRLLQFDEVLSVVRRQQLESMGVKLMGYIPHNAYYASIPAGFRIQSLLEFHPRTMITLLPQDKMSFNLRHGIVPDQCRNKDGSLNMVVVYYPDIAFSEVLEAMAIKGCVMLERFDASFQATFRIPEGRWEDVASSVFVRHIEPFMPSSPEDTKGRSLHRSNAINTDYGAGRHYNGAGVSIALADDGEVGPHIDFSGRMVNTFNTGPGGSHGDMTSGICVGAGNLDPVIRGMATGSQIYIYDIGPYPPDTNAGSYPQITDAAQHFIDFGSVVISTSYSSGVCNDYDAFAAMTDRIFHGLKVVTPVWSAGNSQGADCGYGAGGQWANITGGFKQGKNLIAVANLDAHEVIDNSSSHGPASDGRIKPDISANGKDQMSLAQNNQFQVGGGTSAACPSVAGVTAQCYQAYRELTGEPNPEAALIKGCLLNGAWDIGTPGPDYAFGYGRINGLRAVQTLEQQRYLSDSLLHAGSNTHVITVPSNTLQLKVMLIWTDPEGDPNASIALVNNLDLVVTDPNLADFNPWVLDPTPNATQLALPAQRRVDTLNNMEQVTIDNPVAGSYTLSVTGTTVPFGPQKYYLVYEFWDDAITITYPIGGEGFVPAETEVVRWDAFGTSGGFQLEYSADNGSSWNNIASLPGTARQYDWTVPNTVSGNCLLRITRGASSDVSDAPFSIINTPSGLNVVWACVDSLKLAWAGVPGASGYEVSMLGSMYMDSAGTSMTNELVLHGVDVLDTTWLSVCALTNGTKGRRALAVRKLPGLVNCSLAQDMAITAMTPVSGNFYDCGTGLDSVTVTAFVANQGFNSATGFSLTYTINSLNPVTELFPGVLTFGQTALFSFATPANLSGGGTFVIEVTVNYAGDQFPSNNTLTSTVTVAIAAMAPVVEDFQGVQFPPLYWDTLNSNNQNTWERQSGIIGSGGTSTSAAVFNNCAYNANGASDELITQLVDISGLPYPLMTFDVAYRQWTGYTDALRIDVSTDCGATFVPSGYFKDSPQLTTVNASAGCFTPSSANHWRRDSVDLSSFAGNSVILKFVNIGGYGNLLFIDNVNVQENYLLTTSRPAEQPQVLVYPNPSAGQFTLDLKNFAGRNVVAKVFDTGGRRVGEQELKNASRVTTTFNLSEEPAGVYFLQVSSDELVYYFLLTKL